jgi:hypothetical protein
VNLSAGSKVELPLWLAIAFFYRDHVEIKAAGYLTEQYLNIMRAGPEVVNYRN